MAACSGVNLNSAKAVSIGLADAAWASVRQRFLVPETGLLVDFLGADNLAGLPTADEVRRAFPNHHGYGTGQEDCMIHAGAMLDALSARAEAVAGGFAPSAAWVADDAATLIRGISRCCFAHGRQGFLARSVCREDSSLCYPATSRDQITMATFGLLRFLKSPLADTMPETSCEARRILAAIADFLLANVREDNGWEAPTLDGAIDLLHRCVFWGDGILPHEAARLPLVFTASFAATGESRFATARDRFAAEAIRRSSGQIDPGTPTYALLQMQASLALLAAEVPELAAGAASVMADVASICVQRQNDATTMALAADHMVPAPDWRAAGGLNGQYRETWAALREVGEAAVARLLAGPLTDRDVEQLEKVLRHATPSRATGCGLFHLIEALWRCAVQAVDFPLHHQIRICKIPQSVIQKEPEL